MTPEPVEALVERMRRALWTLSGGKHPALADLDAVAERVKTAEAEIEELRESRLNLLRTITDVGGERDAAEAQRDELVEALEGVAWKDSAGLCWCPGETEFAVAHPNAEHTARCQQARAALAKVRGEAE